MALILVGLNAAASQRIYGLLSPHAHELAVIPLQFSVLRAGDVKSRYICGNLEAIA